MNDNCEREPLQNTTEHEFQNMTNYEPRKNV